MKILIIEDNYYFVEKFFRLFNDLTGESDDRLLTATADPIMAGLLLDKPWDIILIDHDLPNRMSGWILLNNSTEARKKDKAKIIAISAIPENNKRLMAHGAQFSVNKMDCDFEGEIKKLLAIE